MIRFLAGSLGAWLLIALMVVIGIWFPARQAMKDVYKRQPASITLAQGLLESGAGYSELARKSNNHCGIKCGGNWRGRTVRHDDDARNECCLLYTSHGQ